MFISEQPFCNSWAGFNDCKGLAKALASLSIQPLGQDIPLRTSFTPLSNKKEKKIEEEQIRLWSKGQKMDQEGGIGL